MFDIVEISYPRNQVLLLTHSQLPASVLVLIISAVALVGWHYSTSDIRLAAAFWLLVLLAGVLAALGKLIFRWSTRKYTFDAGARMILIDHQWLTDFDDVLDLHLKMHVCADRDCDGGFDTYTLIINFIGDARFVLVSCCDGAPICQVAPEIARLLNRPLIREEIRYAALPADDQAASA